MMRAICYNYDFLYKLQTMMKRHTLNTFMYIYMLLSRCGMTKCCIVNPELASQIRCSYHETLNGYM